MIRDKRITFRLSKHEQEVLSNFATTHNLTVSKSLRRIIAEKFDIATNERGWNPGRR